MKKIIIFIFLFNLSISSALGMSFYPEMDTDPQAPSALIPPPHQIDNTQNIKNQDMQLYQRISDILFESFFFL